MGKDDDNDPRAKLLSIEGGGKVNIGAEMVRGLRENMEYLLEYHKLTAKLRRAHFLALVEEGFNPDQALQIIKENVF